MNHTHRQAIGLELFFSTRSSSFAGLNEVTSSDVDELADNSPVTARLPVAADIRRCVRELLALECCPRDMIPEDILCLAEKSVYHCCRPKSLKVFFNWLMDIARYNENDRVARISSLNGVASCFDTQTASFVRTGFALNNQRVFIARNGNALSVTYPERDWGRVRVLFDGCVFSKDFTGEYLPGYAFSTECSRCNDGGFDFSFLIDTRFAENDYCERLMQSQGWHEVSFRCTSVSVDITACDYAGRLTRLGTPRVELIDRICASLISKKTILGSGGLSSEEQSMLPLASYLTGCGGLLTAEKKDRWKSEQLILDALDNRYAMKQFSGILSSSKCPELLSLFEKSSEAQYEDEDSAALNNSRLYAGAYELLVADGRARPLIAELSDRLCRMTSGFDGSTPSCTAEKEVAGRIMAAVEPQLSALDFRGSYPHYFRIGKNSTEYLSVMLLPDLGRTRKGIKSYYVSLAAAEISGSRMKSMRSLDIDPAEANALDCQPELSSVSKYGELASVDDGTVLRVDADLFRKILRGTDDTPQLERYIRFADRQFKSGSLPAGYSLSRLFHSELPSPLPRLFFSSLPLCASFSLALLIVYLLICESAELPKLTPFQAFGGAAALCFALTAVLTVIRRLIHTFRLWRIR